MRKVFVLVILTFFCASSVEAVITAAAISAASAAISAGTSLAGTSINALTNLNYWVVCGIEVENWTKFTLSGPSVQIKGGALEIPPYTILPGKKEAMVARKTAHTATGSYGTVSWRINCDQQYPPRRAVVMWSAPFNFDYYDNWLGLGLTKPNQINHPTGNAWFDQMYYGKGGNGIDFRRQDYRRDITELLFEDDEFQILGTMSSSHNAKVRIIVRPQSDSDLASTVKALMQKRKLIKAD